MGTTNKRYGLPFESATQESASETTKVRVRLTRSRQAIATKRRCYARFMRNSGLTLCAFIPASAIASPHAHREWTQPNAQTMPFRLASGPA